jgi:hypothetical protein
MADVLNTPTKSSAVAGYWIREVPIRIWIQNGTSLQALVREILSRHPDLDWTKLGEDGQIGIGELVIEVLTLQGEQVFSTFGGFAQDLLGGGVSSQQGTPIDNAPDVFLDLGPSQYMGLLQEVLDANRKGVDAFFDLIGSVLGLLGGGANGKGPSSTTPARSSKSSGRGRARKQARSRN